MDALGKAEDIVTQKGKNPTVLLGIDADVTQRPSLPHTTGEFVARALQSHCRGNQEAEAFVSFLRGVELKADNTFTPGGFDQLVLEWGGRRRRGRSLRSISYALHPIMAERRKKTIGIDVSKSMELRK